MAFFAYILKSKRVNRHYYGHSKNIENRLKDHNNGIVRSTKSYRPRKLVYYETFETKSDAYKKEMFFKSIEGYNFLKLKGII